MFWCQSQVYLGNARFRPGARTPCIYFNLHLSGNVLGQLFPWNLLINKTKSILLSFLQDAHLYESLICLYLSNFLATSYKIKILDYKNFGVRSKPWVCPRQKHVPFSLCISLEITTYFLAYQKSGEWISWIIWHVYIHKEACN